LSLAAPAGPRSTSRVRGAPKRKTPCTPSVSASTTTATKLYNPTFNTTDWLANAPNTTIATEGDGKTRTQALFGQDIWQLTRDLKATFGGRYEKWRACDGYNVNGATTVYQPTLRSSKFSPKATLTWSATPVWTVAASVGKAYRFATASELYQLVSTGTTFTSPNPNLKPDNVLAAELKIERRFEHGMARVSFFQDDVHDAIIAQFNPLLPRLDAALQLCLERRSCPRPRRRVRARGARRVGARPRILRQCDVPRREDARAFPAGRAQRRVPPPPSEKNSPTFPTGARVSSRRTGSIRAGRSRSAAVTATNSGPRWTTPT